MRLMPRLLNVRNVHTMKFLAERTCSVNLPRESEGQSPEIAEGAAERRKNFATQIMYIYFFLFIYLSLSTITLETDHAKSRVLGGAVARARRGTLSQHSGSPASLIAPNIYMRFDFFKTIKFKC